MNMHVVPGPDGLNRRAFSADDVRRMTEAGILGEHDTVELVDGELIEMSPKGFAHDRVRDALMRLLVRGTHGDLNVSVEGTLQLGPRTLLEPDLLVYRDSDAAPSGEGYKVVPGPAVLLAVEISVASLAYDRRRKAGLYARHGIEEYWVVDLAGARAFVHEAPSAGAYLRLREVPATETFSAKAADLSGIEVRLAELT